MTNARSDLDRPNPSAQLLVAGELAEVKLLLWESGDAEFNHGPFGDPRYEHHEVESPEQLDALLERFLIAASGRCAMTRRLGRLAVITTSWGGPPAFSVLADSRLSEGLRRHFLLVSLKRRALAKASHYE